MSTTPLHRAVETRVPFYLAIASGSAAVAMALFAFPFLAMWH